MAAQVQEAARRDIAVVGASAGGVEALQQLVHQLPSSFEGSLFITLHMPRSESLLPSLLGKRSPLPVIVPRDHEPIEAGRIYVAVPDYHLMLEKAAIRVVKGPMLHRHRPAIDVLFRSAATVYRSRVVGVVLTGMLDDGTAGLLEVKAAGGVAVVQDPADAMFPDMPTNALRNVAVDHVLPLVKIPRLLTQLARAQPSERPPAVRSLRAASDSHDQSNPMNENAKPSAYSCPECHGVLWELGGSQLLRFRCRVGHGYSPESLASEQDAAIEDTLWAGVRSLEERASLTRRMAEQWRGRNAEQMARELEAKAERTERHAARLRELLIPAESLDAVEHREA